MKPGDLVNYNGHTYEVGLVKSNSQGVWVQMNPNPRSARAEVMTGFMQEVWILEEALELVEE